MTISAKSLALGFAAAALAVVIAHQGVVLALNTAGVWPSKPWSFAPTGPYQVPTILNQIFWGGIWGIVYALVHTRIPAAQTWVKGILFGLAVAVLGNLLLVPALKGLPLFAAFDGTKIAVILVIHTAFGLGTALIYEALHTRSPVRA